MQFWRKPRSAKVNKHYRSSGMLSALQANTHASHFACASCVFVNGCIRFNAATYLVVEMPVVVRYGYTRFECVRVLCFFS